MSANAAVSIQLLPTADYDAFLAHLMRLDAETRALRFAAGVDDHFLMSHCLGRILRTGFILAARDESGAVIGACEVDVDDDRAVAELAMSVEKPYRGQGIGAALLDATIIEARAAHIGALRIEAAANPTLGRLAARSGFVANRGAAYNLPLDPAADRPAEPRRIAWLSRLFTRRAA